MLSRSNAGRLRAARRRPAYSATIAVIAILCAVVVGHDLFRTWQDRTRQLESTQREAANLSWAVGQHAEAAFILAEATLTGLAERVKIDGTSPEALLRLHKIMVTWVAMSPVLHSMSVVDKSGNVIADSRQATPLINSADRAYFENQQSGHGRQPEVGTILRSKVSGKPIIPVSLRLNDNDDGFAGVVVATLDVAYFEDFYAKLDLGHDGVAGLYFDDGFILVRYPSVESASGSNVTAGALFRDALPKAPGGTFVSVSSIDGMTRINGYRRVTGFPLVVAAALGVNEQLAVWRKGAAEHLFAALVIAVLLAFIGVRLAIQLRRLTHAERATIAAKEAASASAAQYRLIADNASDVVIMIDPQFIRRYVSPGCRELLGYEPWELIGGAPLSLTHPDDAERLAGCLREVTAGADRVLSTCRVLHRDGHWVPVEVSMKAIRDPESGKPLEICAALRDITQRLATEATLRDRERDLERSNADLRELEALNIASRYARGLLEASLDPLVAISREGKITDVNDAMVNVTGVSRGSLIGTDFSDYFTDPARAREGYRRVFADGSVTDYPLTIRHQNKTLTEVLYNASIYKNAEGIVLGAFAAARDMTAQLRAEAEVAERRAREHERLEELERFQRLTVGRELKMIDLKKEIETLKKTRMTAGIE
jgi:PAS domain S-box-containing protein